MKQTVFCELLGSIREGDTIRIPGSSLAGSYVQEIDIHADQLYEATLLKMRHVGKFSMQLLLAIDLFPGALFISDPVDHIERFELLSWKQKSCLSAFAQNFEPGDQITYWGSTLTVLSNAVVDTQTCAITTRDESDQSVTSYVYKNNTRILWKLRDLNEREIEDVFANAVAVIDRSTPKEAADAIARILKEWDV